MFSYYLICNAEVPRSKPYDNEPHFDPGLFRVSLEFRQQTAVVSSSGDSAPTKATVKTMKAAELPIRDGDQLAIEAGASIMKRSRYYITRKVSSFYPTKSMNFNIGTKEYVINAVIPLGSPEKYVKILATPKNG